MTSQPATLTKLEYLDGLRGLAALYVVLFHAILGFRHEPEDVLTKVLLRLFCFGHEAVAVFIVLSGYCLTLSATRGGKRPFQVEFFPFLRRRARRILPPYFVALCGSLLLIALVPALGVGKLTGSIWQDSHPAFSRASLVTHFLLIHNWFPETVHTINGPLWSVATEWQIYLLLPTVFVPVYRRRGALGMIAVAAALGYGALAFWPEWSRTAISWYTVLFAVGSAGALLHVGPQGDTVRRLRRLPWNLIASAFTVLLALSGLGAASIWFRYQPMTDLLVGLCTAAVLIAAAEGSLGGGLPGPLKVLSSRFALGLGRISYSLYLSHLPILALVAATLEGAGVSPWVYRATMGIGGSVASLAVAALLYVSVERHFLNHPASERSR